ncbi:MAG: porin [Gammaproteobacteria bacterium]|nr:porin [Gammaproteobacteria bacterium]
MNKKLLALAVAAALAPAAAMADSGNVTIYGVMDASYDLTDNGNGAATAGGAVVNGIRANKISSNNSRLGFKGSEDLGNGLSAVWQIESTIAVDTGASSLATRNTFVGLSSKTAGTAILGRHDTPYKMSTRGYDYFSDGLADNRNLMGAGITKTGSFSGGSFDGRPNNVVAYMSPNMNGFKAAAAYVAGAEDVATSGDKKGDAWSLSGNYANGPLTAALAYERHKLGGLLTGDLAATSAALVDKTEKAWKLGVGYSFGDLMVNGVYEKISDDFTTSNGHKAYTLGAKYKIGSNDLKLAYIKAGDLDGGQTSTGAKQWALGVDHHMSKRTKVFAQYVKLSNDTNAKYGLTGANPTGKVSAKGYDADPSAWSFGMRHVF